MFHVVWTKYVRIDLRLDWTNKGQFLNDDFDADLTCCVVLFEIIVTNRVDTFDRTLDLNHNNNKSSNTACV